MFTQRLRVVAACLVALPLTTTLAACQSDGQASTPPTSGLAVVVGSHANQPRISNQEYRQAVQPHLVENVHVSLFSDEGNPASLGTSTLTDLPNNPHNRADAIEEFESMMLAAIADATPTTFETDPLRAIGDAARAVRHHPGACTIVVGSSMLQTTGAIDMTVEDETRQSLLYAEPADVVEALQSADALPDLAGCEVVLLGLGATQAPQDGLDEGARRRLEAFWRAILESSGAQVRVMPATITRPAPDGLPAVTPVPVDPVVIKPPAREPAVTPGEPTPASPPAQEPCSVNIPDSAIGFRPDSAEFLDADEARRVIDDVIAGIGPCEGTITVIGTTSSAGTPEGRQRVSTQRAGAVRELLADQLGVPAASIHAEGLGFDLSTGWVVQDRVDGALDSALAQLNRQVIVLVEVNS